MGELILNIIALGIAGVMLFNFLYAKVRLRLRVRVRVRVRVRGTYPSP